MGNQRKSYLKQIIIQLCISFLLINAGYSLNVQLFITSSVAQVHIFIVPAGTTFYIDFPNDFQNQPLTYDACKTTLWPYTVNITCKMENRRLTIQNGFPNQVNSRDVMLFFDVENIVNPLASGETQTFKAKFVDNMGSIFAETDTISTTTLVFTTGILDMQMSTYPTIVNSISSVTISVTTLHKIPKDGYLSLKFDTFWKTNIINSTRVVSQVFCSPLEVRCILIFRMSLANQDARLQ